MLNEYELGARAMALHDSIPCGPEPRTCDLDAPCPNHGGDQSDSDDWTAHDEAALLMYLRRWQAEVLGTPIETAQEAK